MALYKKVFAILALGLFVSACATTTSSSGDDAASIISKSSNEDGYVLTRIAEPELPAGECGMILWTLEEQRPAPVFKFLTGGVGTISVNDAPLQLTLLQSEGARAFGIAEAQSFSDEAGLFDVSVAVRMGLGFDGGTYLERGLITIENQEGWRTVIPVAGIAGCRNK